MPELRQTHTYTTLEISREAFDEILRRLTAASDQKDIWRYTDSEQRNGKPTVIHLGGQVGLIVEKQKEASDTRDLSGAESEAKITQAVAIMRTERKASISLFQRRLGLGYINASCLMDQLIERGYVQPPANQSSFSGPISYLVNFEKIDGSDHPRIIDLTESAFSFEGVVEQTIRALRERSIQASLQDFHRCGLSMAMSQKLLDTLIDRDYVKKEFRQEAGSAVQFHALNAEKLGRS